MRKPRPRTLNDKIYEADNSDLNLNIEAICGGLIAAVLLIALSLFVPKKSNGQVPKICYLKKEYRQRWGVSGSYIDITSTAPIQKPKNLSDKKPVRYLADSSEYVFYRNKIYKLIKN